MGLGVLIKGMAVKLFAFFCIFCLVLASLPVLPVLAQEEAYPLIFGKKPETEEPVLELWMDEEEYVVRPGECLWDIAENLWGEGARYTDILEKNKNMITNEDLIYPGMSLKTAGRGYIVRKDAKYGGVQMGEYSMDMPGGWTAGVISSGDAYANFALSGNGISGIACLIQDKRQETEADVQDWQKAAEKIQKYAEENYPGKVSDLTFEHYGMENDEAVCLYSFTYRADLADYEMDGVFACRVCVGMKLTEHIQAQFVGYAVNYDIESCVRYVTASFEEHTQGYDLDEFTVSDSNMAISPESPWELEGMFNSFAWIDEFFTALIKRAAGIEPEKSPKENLVDKMTRTGK